MAQLQRVACRPNQISNHQVVLDPYQTHYLCQVLRLRAGDRFIAMDGQGHWWLTQLQDQGATAAILEHLTVNHELPLPIHLIAAPVKGNGFESVIRSATELGAASIIPLLSQRTLLRPSPQKLDRWRRIVGEAAEQCQRQFIPTLSDPISIKDVRNGNIAVNTDDTARWICSTAIGAQNLWRYLTTTQSPYPSQGITVMTGPEGGWSAAEEAQMIALGYQPISLGSRVLRAITAPITVLSILSVHLDAQTDD